MQTVTVLLTRGINYAIFVFSLGGKILPRRGVNFTFSRESNIHANGYAFELSAQKYKLALN